MQYGNFDNVCAACEIARVRVRETMQRAFAPVIMLNEHAIWIVCLSAVAFVSVRVIQMNALMAVDCACVSMQEHVCMQAVAAALRVALGLIVTNAGTFTHFYL